MTPRSKSGCKLASSWMLATSAWTESWLLPIALGVGLRARLRAGIHSTTLTRVFTFISPHSIHRVGGRGRVAGKTRVTLSSSRLLPPRGQSQHVHHGRLVLKTTDFVAAASDDSHGLLLGLCGHVAVVVVAACPWSRLEHGQRIALLWGRGTC